ncbi:MAG: site-specific integrase [Phycisphaerae bacterium]
MYQVRKTRRRQGYGRRRAPWVLRWRDPPPAGPVRQRTLGPGSERWAERHRQLWQAELNGFEGRAETGTPWRRFAARYLEARGPDLAPASLALARQTLARFQALARPRLLQHVTRRTVNAYRLTRLRAVGEETARKDVRTLRAAFAWAVAEGMLPGNPCDGIRWGRRMRRRPEVLSARRTRQLLAALREETVPTWLQAALGLAARWGPRTGELARLEREDVDWGERLVWIRVKASGAPKGRAERAFPLDAEAAGLLQELGHRDGPILWGPRAKPFACERQFRQRLCEGARDVMEGLGLGRPVQPIQLLRRTAETNLRDRGVDPRLVGAVLGHGTSVGDRYYDGAPVRDLARRLAEWEEVER